MDKDSLEILLEDIRGKFDLVLEGHSSLQKCIENAEQNLNDKISLVDFKVGVLNQKIDGVRDELNQKIDGVEATLSKRIDGVEATLSKRIDGVEATLSKRIDGVEATLSRKIDAVAADLAAHRRDTEAHPAVYKVKEP